MEVFGKFDVMVNNVGIVGVVGLIVEILGEFWERIVVVFFDGVFYGMKYVVCVMKLNKSGSILFIVLIVGV